MKSICAYEVLPNKHDPDDVTVRLWISGKLVMEVEHYEDYLENLLRSAADRIALLRAERFRSYELSEEQECKVINSTSGDSACPIEPAAPSVP